MPILFDSSVYIAAFRLGGDHSLVSSRWTAEAPLWLSSVVLEELYEGLDLITAVSWRDLSAISIKPGAF